MFLTFWPSTNMRAYLLIGYEVRKARKAQGSKSSESRSASCQFRINFTLYFQAHSYEAFYDFGVAPGRIEADATSICTKLKYPHLCLIDCWNKCQRLHIKDIWPPHNMSRRVKFLQRHMETKFPKPNINASRTNKKQLQS